MSEQTTTPIKPADDVMSPRPPASTPPRAHRGLRLGFAAAIVLVVVTYIVLIIAIPLKPERRLGTVEFGLLLVAGVVAWAILNPGVFNKVKTLKGWGWEVELNEQLQQQRQDLDAIRFVLTMVLSPEQREHLTRLADGRTQNYEGRESLRKELRALRDLGLIGKREGRHIGELKDGARVDLSQVVTLTPRGRDYLKRLQQYELEGRA
jgi:hypothetical protein